MTGALIVSQVLLWAVVIVLGLVVLALARQLGLVLVRTGPLGGAAVTDEGPAIGSQITSRFVTSTEGIRVQIPDAAGRRTLLVFLSQSCPACVDLIPSLRSLVASETADISVVLATVPNATPVSPESVSKLAGVGAPYIADTSLAAAMNVRGFPYAVVLSPSGVTQSKGIVNNIVQLESLLQETALEGRARTNGRQEAGSALDQHGPEPEEELDVAVRS